MTTDEIILLDVGGVRFKTTRDTLLRWIKLAVESCGAGEN